MAVYVVVPRDWVDWVLFWLAVGSLVATVAAAVLALLAILTANRTARKADEAPVRERRATFELATLARVAELYSLRAAGSADALRGLILTLPDDDFPTLRTFLSEYRDPSMPNTDDAQTRAEFRQELRRAVDRRMAT